MHKASTQESVNNVEPALIDLVPLVYSVGTLVGVSLAGFFTICRTYNLGAGIILPRTTGRRVRQDPSARQNASAFLSVLPQSCLSLVIPKASKSRRPLAQT